MANHNAEVKKNHLQALKSPCARTHRDKIKNHLKA